ncbi:hypothetical protein [Geoalkalibacter halelectricus]|uniref:DUF5610 domain-containing protein n=1 Tax=Geoalkalibacter halelectricus TaxID=2847045 RepID=A0ABY5ZUK7_9BACT|nr:hypothetical protein [Geoalkalibacter halelectricus]MDO3377952.1 hypothetical protein [Geoalkalibacter halelectricus]UWZ81545.1 hypothetical protein L9S41_09135 [Geoalkalibacter halelectricus]
MVKGIEGGSFAGVKHGAGRADDSGREKLDKLKEQARAGVSVGDADKVSLAGETKAEGVYKAQGVRAELSPQFELLRQLVAKTLGEQGAAFSVSINGEDKGISDLTPEDAQKLIAEDGYFGVDQTSQRIVDFAIGLAGNDPSKLDQILAGVERGFNEAAQAFGGSLPEISYQTLDAIREKLDAWVEGLSRAD